MKSWDLRLLLSMSGSRRLFVVAFLSAVLWSAIIIANALLIAEVIVRMIRHQPDTKYILALGFLWLIRALFQARFEYWCTSQAIRIKRDLRIGAHRK